MVDSDGGVFVAVEGLDGAGTTTQVERVADALAEVTRRSVVETAEPTDGPVGELIRAHLGGEIDVGPDTLAMLFAADRLEHCREIGDRLAAGDVVVTDRYALSSYAYQAVDADADLDWLRTINRAARTPDVTVFVDVPPEECVDRLDADERGEERFERLDTLEDVRASYGWAITVEREAGNDVRVIDGDASVETVTDRILAELADVLGVDA